MPARPIDQTSQAVTPANARFSISTRTPDAEQSIGAGPGRPGTQRRWLKQQEPSTRRAPVVDGAVLAVERRVERDAQRRRSAPPGRRCERTTAHALLAIRRIARRGRHARREGDVAGANPSPAGPHGRVDPDHSGSITEQSSSPPCDHASAMTATTTQRPETNGQRRPPAAARSVTRAGGSVSRWCWRPVGPGAARTLTRPPRCWPLAQRLRRPRLLAPGYCAEVNGTPASPPDRTPGTIGIRRGRRSRARRMRSPPPLPKKWHAPAIGADEALMFSITPMRPDFHLVEHGHPCGVRMLTSSGVETNTAPVNGMTGSGSGLRHRCPAQVMIR